MLCGDYSYDNKTVFDRFFSVPPVILVSCDCSIRNDATSIVSVSCRPRHREFLGYLVHRQSVIHQLFLCNVRVTFSFTRRTCSPKRPLLNLYCGNRLNSKFYFQGPKQPIPPRIVARVIDMPMTTGHDLERPSSHFNDNESIHLHHSDGPETVNEIGLGGFPFYHDVDSEKHNVC
jgi:hypothetical protein